MKRILLAAALATSSAFAAPPEPKFRHAVIDPRVQIGYGVAVADVDGDGKPDVLLADKKHFAWYKNPGGDVAGTPWTKHVMAENLTERDNVCIAAQDIDGDGKCEVAVGAEWNPGDTEKSGAVFYLVAPEDRAQRWEAIKFPHVEPTTHRMRWLEYEKGKWGLVVVPLHGRGNKNAEGAPVKVLLYRKPADPKAEWQTEVVDETLHATHNFDIGTVQDGPAKGSPLILLGGREGTKLIARGEAGWKELQKTSDVGAGEVRMGLDAKQRAWFAAVEPMHGNQLAAYVNTGTSSEPGKWTVERRQLTDGFVEGHALACGDVLGAGFAQIVAGWRGSPQKPRPVGIKLYTPMDEAQSEWRESTVDDNGMACEDLTLADLNGDGKLDIVASGRSTRILKIYINETAKGI